MGRRAAEITEEMQPGDLLQPVLIFCVGSLMIVGALESGLTGNHDKLFAKSVLDGISSIVLHPPWDRRDFSSLTVFVYQGLITIAAGFVKDFLTEDVIRNVRHRGL